MYNQVHDGWVEETLGSWDKTKLNNNMWNLENLFDMGYTPMSLNILKIFFFILKYSFVLNLVTEDLD